MKISVIWTWYIWLIQAVWMSKLGFQVTSIDVFAEKIHKLKSWIPTIFEEWLDDLLKETYKNIDFTTDTSNIIWSDAIFICVWTPQDDEWKTDLWYVYSACKGLKQYLSWNEIIIIKSTVPVWTNSKIYKLLWEKNTIVSNPEFLREWVAIKDFFNPDRIVVGLKDTDDTKIIEKLKFIYSTFTEKNIPLFITDWQTAELIKYAANSFLATKITFINEIARLSDKVWANIKDIAEAIWMDERIWKQFLNAWIWYGWSCFPKDVKSLIHQFKENGLEWNIISKVDETNTSQVYYFTKKIFDFYNWNMHWKVIWVLWIAFKPGTDDLRESKWIEIIKKLMHAWAKVKVYDYNKEALNNFKNYISWVLLANSRGFFEVEIKESFNDLINNCDSLVLTLEDNKIKKENFKNIKLRDNVIFDWKNILDRNNIKKYWINYIGIGY